MSNCGKEIRFLKLKGETFRSFEYLAKSHTDYVDSQNFPFHCGKENILLAIWIEVSIRNEIAPCYIQGHPEVTK